MPLFSIIVPTFNRAQMLRETLLSIEKQTFQDYECLVVDNASTDDTPHVLEEYKTRPRFRVFRNPVNKGQQYSRNRAIKEAAGTWVTFLDSDDLWFPTRLEEFHQAIAVRPAVGFWFSDGYWLEGSSVVGGFFDGHATIPEGVVPGYYAVGSRFLPYVTTNVCLRRDTFVKWNYYREDMQILEDTEFYAKVLASGVPVGVIPKKLSLYRLHATQMTQKHWVQFKESLMALEAGGASPDILKGYREELARSKAVFLLKSGQPALAREFLIKEVQGKEKIFVALTWLPGWLYRLLRLISRAGRAVKRSCFKTEAIKNAERFYAEIVRETQARIGATHKTEASA